MRDRTKRAAEHWGILNKLMQIEKTVLSVDGVVYDESENGVCFDVDNYYDCKYIILVPRYDYHKGNAWQIALKVLKAIKPYGLVRTEDVIEDYGEHIYIVTEGI